MADTPARKLHDAIVAVALEQALTKEEILTHDLNTVYFGHDANGTVAAAHTYFATTADALTLPRPRW